MSTIRKFQELEVWKFSKEMAVIAITEDRNSNQPQKNQYLIIKLKNWTQKI